MIPSIVMFSVLRNKTLQKNLNGKKTPIHISQFRYVLLSQGPLIDISQVVIALVSQYDTVPSVSDPTLHGA
jgi:hypothetical protein